MNRAAFKRLMTHRVKIVKLERNYTGKLVPVTEYFNVPAFVQYGRRLVVDREGEEVSVAAIVFLRHDAPIKPEHEHWEITHMPGYEMQVVRIDRIDDPRTGRVHHYEVAVR